MNTVMSKDKIRGAFLRGAIGVAQDQDLFTKSELAKAVREMINAYNPNHQSTEYRTFEIVREAILKVLERK